MNLIKLQKKQKKTIKNHVAAHLKQPWKLVDMQHFCLMGVDMSELASMDNSGPLLTYEIFMSMYFFFYNNGYLYLSVIWQVSKGL